MSNTFFSFFSFCCFLLLLEREARTREIIISYPIVAGGRAKQASCREIRVVFCLFILGGKKGEGIWGGAKHKTDRYGIRLGYGLGWVHRTGKEGREALGGGVLHVGDEGQKN